MYRPIFKSMVTEGKKTTRVVMRMIPKWAQREACATATTGACSTQKGSEDVWFQTFANRKQQWWVRREDSPTTKERVKIHQPPTKDKHALHQKSSYSKHKNNITWFSGEDSPLYFNVKSGIHTVYKYLSTPHHMRERERGLHFPFRNWQGVQHILGWPKLIPVPNKAFVD